VVVSCALKARRRRSFECYSIEQNTFVPAGPTNSPAVEAWMPFCCTSNTTPFASRVCYDFRPPCFCFLMPALRPIPVFRSHNCFDDWWILIHSLKAAQNADTFPPLGPEVEQCHWKRLKWRGSVCNLIRIDIFWDFFFFY
jgi:hypothetical protein